MCFMSTEKILNNMYQSGDYVVITRGWESLKDSKVIGRVVSLHSNNTYNVNTIDLLYIEVLESELCPASVEDLFLYKLEQ